MPYSWEEFSNAYQNAPSHVKEWIDSDAGYNVAKRIQNDQGIKFESSVHRGLMRTISRY